MSGYKKRRARSAVYCALRRRYAAGWRPTRFGLSTGGRGNRLSANLYKHVANVTLGGSTVAIEGVDQNGNIVKEILDLDENPWEPAGILTLTTMEDIGPASFDDILVVYGLKNPSIYKENIREHLGTGWPKRFVPRDVLRLFGTPRSLAPPFDETKLNATITKIVMNAHDEWMRTLILGDSRARNLPIGIAQEDE